MQTLELEHKHTRFHIGHSFMALGIFFGLLLSLMLSTFPVGKVLAFGSNEVAVLSNQARTSNGLSPLTLNSQLASAAQAKANDMIANNYFDHTSPSGVTGWYFIKQTGYSYITAGENLAASNESADAVVTGWLNSPGHRANLLNSSFRDVGYGIVYKGDFEGYSGVYFVVALYAQPVQSKPSPAPTANTTPTSGTSVKQNSTAAPTPTPAQTASPAPTSTSTPLSLETDPNQLILKETPSGTSTALSKPKFQMTKRIALSVAGTAATLVLVGAVIDIYKLFKHAPGLHTFHHSH